MMSRVASGLAAICVRVLNVMLVDLDVVGIVQVEIAGQALDEDYVGDGGLREPQDDELIASAGGACLVGDDLHVTLADRKLQQPLQLAFMTAGLPTTRCSTDSSTTASKRGAFSRREAAAWPSVLRRVAHTSGTRLGTAAQTMARA